MPTPGWTERAATPFLQSKTQEETQEYDVDKTLNTGLFGLGGVGLPSSDDPPANPATDTPSLTLALSPPPPTPSILKSRIHLSFAYLVPNDLSRYAMSLSSCPSP